MSSPVATIRRRGNLADCSVDLCPLPREVSARLETYLTYEHVVHLRGEDAYCSDGVRRPYRKFPTALYSYDANGLLVFPQGFRRAVTSLLLESGYTVTEVCCDGPRSRPNCFEFRPERVFELLGPNAFRPKQADALAAIASNEGGLIGAATAFGKTQLILMACLSFPNAKITIVADGQEVAMTIRNRLMAHIPGVGLVGAGKRNFGRRITVFVADSLHHEPHDPEGEPDIVFFDEVHGAASPSNLERLARYQRARMFGLSASLFKRSDNADHRLEGIFGPLIFNLTVPEAEALGLVSPVLVEMISVEMSSNPADKLTQDTARERAAIWNNEYRNQMVADQARRFPDDVQVLIMVKSIEHGLRLRKLLPEFEFCYDKISEQDRQYYTRIGLLEHNEATMTKPKRQRLRQEFESTKLKKCIANGVWSTGVDFVSLSVLIRVDGMASRIMSDQIPGRAMRIHESKPHALLIDFFDRFDNTKMRHSQDRRTAYLENGWKVVTVSPTTRE